MKKLLIALCALTAACDSPTVPERFLRDVYDFRLLTPTPQIMRWPIGTTVSVFVTPDTSTARTAFLRDAVTHAARVWNDAALYGEVQIAQTDDIGNADVVVQYTPATSPVELANCPPGGGMAYTTFCLTTDREHLTSFPLTGGGPSRVKFVVTVRASAAPDAASVRRLVTHELGHVLGIAQHSPRETDLMHASASNRDAPSPADRATLQVLYHTLPDITP